MNLQQILNKASSKLKLKNIKSYKLDSELLLAKTLNVSREEVLLNLNKKIEQSEIKKFSYYINLRNQYKPVAYIINYKFFWKYKFFVNKDVLIPRPETELIIERTLSILSKKSKKNILEIGTGSGCVAVSLIKERPNCRIVAIDKSPKAIKVAKKNAEIHQVGKKIKFLNIDVDKYFTNKYDIIISNPPYITNSELLSLDKDVKLNEPKIALSGGFSGLEIFFKIINKCNRLLKNNGMLILEIGHKQGNKLKQYLKSKGFNKIKIYKDLSGKSRCLISTKNH
ncbi:MAG: peptide chain release factor N(5)-glutamine methyltransferase [Candidatus Pelagibacter sp.]